MYVSTLIPKTKLVEYVPKYFQTNAQTQEAA